jgi:hypothetical protein
MSSSGVCMNKYGVCINCSGSCCRWHFDVSHHQHDCALSAVHSNLSFMREFPPVFYFRVDAVFWSVSCQTTLVSSCNVPVSIFCHCRVKLILSQQLYTYCASTRRLIILICGVAQGWGMWRSSLMWCGVAQWLARPPACRKIGPRFESRPGTPAMAIWV